MTIACENAWHSPVKFTLTQPNSPFEIVTVVDEHNYVHISTAQHWTCYAICNGITSATVTISDPNAKDAEQPRLWRHSVGCVIGGTKTGPQNERSGVPLADGCL